MAHYSAMSEACDSRSPDFRQARHPSKVYRGVCENGEYLVTVYDSSLPEGDNNPRVLPPDEARHVRDCCDRFQWGSVESGALQLAIALLLDVNGDTATALCWYEHFAATFVRELPAAWIVSELDVALWLHCFQNARPGAQTAGREPSP